MNSKSSNDSRYRHSLNSQQEVLIESISGARAVISHPGEKGMEIEEKIREALLRVLPEKIGVSHGFVIDSNDEISKQMDIVLYDKMNTPKIYNGDHVQIFPVESTYACGEIKTTLDSGKLKDVFEKCLSYKNLHRKAYFPRKGVIKNTVELFGEKSEHWKSIFFCITYESADLVELCRECSLIIDHKGLSLDKQVDTIVALNNPADHHNSADEEDEDTKIVTLNNPADPCNIMCNAKIDPESGELAYDSVNFLPYPESFLCISRAEHSWALFIALLLRYMVQAPPQIINMLEYNRSGPF